MRSSLGAALALALIGCGDGATGAPMSSAVATASAPAPTATPAAPAQKAADLDVEKLKNELGCDKTPKSAGACAIVAKLGSCKPWAGATPSGEGRWFGRGVEIDKKGANDVFVMFRARRIPTAEAQPGDLPVKIAIEPLPKEEKNASDAADRAVRILERQDVAPRYQPALDFLKRKDAWAEGTAIATANGQLYSVQKFAAAHVCLGPKQQLLVVRDGRTAPGAADFPNGLYAEVWATSW